MPNEKDVRDAADVLQSDMAEHQRRFGGTVTADANQRLVATEFEKLDRQGVFDREQPEGPMPDQFPGPAEEIVEGHGLIGIKEKKDIKTRPPTEAEALFMLHALPRIQLLLSKTESSLLGGPSWSARIIAVQESRALAASLRLWASNAAVFRKQKAGIMTMNPIDRGHMFRVLGMTGPSEFTREALNDKATDLEKQYLAELLLVLDESSLVFGDWRRLPDAPILFGGKN